MTFERQIFLLHVRSNKTAWISNNVCEKEEKLVLKKIKEIL